MTKKNYLFIGKHGGTAVSESKPEQSITISDGKIMAEISKLVEARKEAGLKLSRLLRQEGLTASEDDETTIPD